MKGTVTLRREQIEELYNILRGTEDDWEYLSGEEIYGSVHMAAEELDSWRDLCKCNECGREVTLMGNGRCGKCQAKNNCPSCGRPVTSPYNTKRNNNQ